MKKIFLAIIATLALALATTSCTDNLPNNPNTEEETLDAKVFFATDAHSMVSMPAFTEVWVDDKLVGTLTNSIAPETVLLDSLRQCNPDSLYSYVVIYKVDQPKGIKYQFVVKSALNKDIIQTISNELNIDKSGNYNAFHILYKE